jgi:hypothetical protein
MNIFNENLKIFIFTLASLLLGIFLWDKISLPFSNSQNVYGILEIKKFHPLNNELRFLTLISLVFGTFTLSLIFLKKNLNTFSEIIFFNREIPDNNNQKHLNIIFLVFSFFLVIEFLSISFPLKELDFLHEGERLSPAKNYLINNKIWSGSLFIHGLFIDLFEPIVGWKFFGNETIGAYRLFLLILIFFSKIVSLFLCFKIAKLINADQITKIIYFTLISIAILLMIQYIFAGSGRYLNHRELPILFFLIFSIDIIFKKKKILYPFLIGALSSLSIFFILDRGIYVNLLTLFLLAYCLLRKELKVVSFIISGVILTWSFIYFSIGEKEFNSFFQDTMHYLSIKDFLDAYIYPTPFIAEKFFVTKGILLIIFSGLLAIYGLIVKNKDDKNSLNFYFFIIFLFGLLIYNNALGRVDPDHIRYSSSISIFLICLIIFKKISFIINKKLILRNLNFITSFLIVLFLTIMTLNTLYGKGQYNQKKIGNIINLIPRINNYIKLTDKIFLNPDILPVLNYYKKISKEDNCVQALTNEAAWTYLTKKQMCTKFYIIWYAASDKFQRKFIDEFSKSNAKYILVDAPYSNGGAGKLYIDNIDYKKRHPLIFEYLNENFEFHKNINGWIFYIRKY